MMAWVAFDRGIKSSQEFDLPGPIEDWRRVRDEIHHDVCTNGYDRDLGHFVQAYGGTELDASLLLIPSIGFLPPTDRRVRATIEAIERELLVDGFVDVMTPAGPMTASPPGKACFWHAASGWPTPTRCWGASRMPRNCSSDCWPCAMILGLLSEEYDPEQRCLVGNFPQAFSHISLVNTAHNFRAPTNLPIDGPGGKQVVVNA